MAIALASLLATGTPSANGRFPTAQHVVIGPGASSDVVAMRVTFGVLLSTDGGGTFHWFCEEGMFYPFVPALNFDPPVEIAARGDVVFGYEEGIRYSADACGTGEVRVASRHSFSDLTSDPSGRILYAIEAGSGVPNAVYRGDGMTLEFTRVGAGVTGVYFDTIEVAPSNPRRLYLTGRDDTFRSVFFRSDDGGETLALVAPDGDAAPADSLWVSGVDPRDPDTLYVRAAVGLGTELRRSRDGGRTFRRVAATAGQMLGFAMSDDGRTLWFGSIEGGLQRSDDGGESFRPVNRVPILCLRQHQGVLWACSDWVNQPFALGRSRDRGATFEPALRFSDFNQFRGPPACATRSEGAAVCVERWSVFQRMFANPGGADGGTAPPRDAGSRDASMDVASPVDAALDAPPLDASRRDAGASTPPSSACNCTVPGPGPGARDVGIMAAIGALLRRRRARGALAASRCLRAPPRGPRQGNP